MCPRVAKSVCCLAGAIVLVVLGGVGCGGTSGGTSNAPKKYTNSTYGFSVTYGAPLKAAGTSVPRQAQGVACTFLDPKAEEPGNSEVTSVEVAVRGSVTAPVSSAQDAIGRAAWWAAEVGMASQFSKFRVISIRQVDLNGAPALLFEGEGVKNGQHFHVKTMAVIVGGRLYDLLGQCPATKWNTTGRVVSDALDSFTLTSDLKALAVATARRAAKSVTKARDYVNTTYGFRLRLAADFQQSRQNTVGKPSSGQWVFEVAFASTNLESLLPLLVVTVEPPVGPLSKAEIPALVRSMTDSAAWAATEQDYASQYPGIKLGRLHVADVGGQPAVAFDATYTSPLGIPQHLRAYELFSTKCIYHLELHASQSVWARDVGTLERMAQSFRAQ